MTELKLFKTGTEATTTLICTSCIFAASPAFATGFAVVIGAAKLYDFIQSNIVPFGNKGRALKNAVEIALKDNRAAFVGRYRDNKDIESELTRIENNFRETLPKCRFEITHIAEAAKDAAGFANKMAADVMAGLAKADEEFATGKESDYPYQFIHSSLVVGFKAAVLDSDNFKSIEPEILLNLTQSVADNSAQLSAVLEGLKAQDEKLGDIHIDLREGNDDVLNKMSAMEARLMEKLSEKHIVSDEDLSSSDFFERFAAAHKIPLNELLGLVSGVLDQNIDPRNFGQLLDMAKAALEKVKIDYERLSHLANEAPEIKPFLDKARAALENQDAIDLKEAQTELRAARREYDKRVIKRFNEEQENSAQMIVLEAQLALAQSNIDEAVFLYDEAIAKVTHNTDLLQSYMWAKGELLSDFGELSPEPDMLIQSAEVWKELLDISPKENNPEYWANVKGMQGNIALTLGKRRAGDKDLLFAVDCYRATLSVFTQEDHAEGWATTQNNLGNALLNLGERSSDDALLHEAVAAYRSALEERTQDRVPLGWAATQNNLGNALSILGSRSSDDTFLHEAVVAYRSALEEWTQARVPLDWAMTQNNLGNALSILGGRSSDTALLHEAVTAYRSALEERTQDRVPLDWALTQNNLGTALQTLGSRSSDDTLLHEAVVAYRSALEEWTQDRVPLDWAMTQNNLGNALSVLGERSSNEALLQDAIAAYRSALTEFSEDNTPYYHKQTMENLATAEKILAKIRTNKAE